MITYCLNFRARTVFEIMLFITLILGLCSVLERSNHLLQIHQLILRDLHNIQPFLHVGQYYSQSIILLYFYFYQKFIFISIYSIYFYFQQKQLMLTECKQYSRLPICSVLYVYQTPKNTYCNSHDQMSQQRHEFIR